jgi:hypothetical protein
MLFITSEGSLRKFLFSALSCFIAASIILPLAGCIAHAPGSGGGGQQQQILVTVTSSPVAPASVPVSTASTPSTVQYTATVAGTSNQAVTWTVAADPTASNGICSATGSQLGTVATAGNNTMTYTAPQGPLPISPCGVVVTATSDEDNTTSGQALVNVHVIVNIAAAPGTIGQRGNLQYSATVTGAPLTTEGQDIQWSASNGGAFDNPIYNNGLYVAPPLTGGESPINVTIQATSSFDPTQTASLPVTVEKTDPLGTIAQTTAASAQITCPTFTGGSLGATCYQLKVSCDAIADYYAYLKVNTPAGTPAGTVILGTGGGGTSLYDKDPNFIGGTFNGGDYVVEGILSAGFTTVQVSFGDPFTPQPAQPNGWLQGPGGVRRVACRYATVADWVYKNIHNSSTAAPYCATGNSGGSGAIGYAVSEYGLASEFTLIEPTSGPVMTLLHQGCNVCGQYTGSNACTQTSGVNLCYTASGGTGSTAAIIDLAYQSSGQTTPTLCTNGVNRDNSNFTRFLSDSIEDDPGISPALPIPNPPTTVNILFGADDPSNAIPMGYAWRAAVGPTPPFTCVPGTSHAVPSTSAGAQQIVDDITGKNFATTGIGCVLPSPAGVAK